MDQWLVRTANNILAGPYSRDQVVRLIQEGKLGLQDEVCQGNHYWIFLHEHVEVERQLGIHMPRTQGEDDEITETQTDAVNGSRSSSQAPEIETAPLPQMPNDYDGSTAVFSHSPVREVPKAGPAPRSSASYPAAAASSQSRPGVQAAAPASMSEMQIERPSIWKSFAWLMIFAFCVLVFLVLRLLHSAHV